MKPTLPCTDRRFKYVPAAGTDIRRTFARARAEIRAQKQQELLRRTAEQVFPGYCAEAVR